MQLLSEGYKKLTTKDENATKRREERRKKRKQEAESKSSPATNQICTSENDNAENESHTMSQLQEAPAEDVAANKEEKEQNEVKIDDLLRITEPKYEEPLPTLPSDLKPAKEELHHITQEEMRRVELETSLPFSITDESVKGDVSSNQPLQEINANPVPEKPKAISVIDYNGSGKEVVVGHHLSMDNEELIPEKEDEFEERKYGRRMSGPNKKKLEIIQEKGNSELNSNPSSLAHVRSTRHNRKQCNLAIDKLKGIPETHCNEDNSPNICANDDYINDDEQSSEMNFRRRYQNNSAREPNNERKFVRKFRRGRAKSSRDSKCNQSEIITEDSSKQEPKLDTSEKLREIRGKIKEVQQYTGNGRDKQNFHSSNSMSMGGMKTISTLPKGTGECSTTYTIATHNKSFTKRPMQTFISGESKGTADNLGLSTEGASFGAGPLSGYTGTNKGTMFQSFNTNKPTLPAGLSGNIIKQGTGNSASIIIKKLDESTEYSGILKIRKKNIIPITHSPGVIAKPTQVLIQRQGDEQEGKVFKRLRLKKANL